MDVIKIDLIKKELEKHGYKAVVINKNYLIGGINPENITRLTFPIVDPASEINTLKNAFSINIEAGRILLNYGGKQLPDEKQFDTTDDLLHFIKEKIPL